MQKTGEKHFFGRKTKENPAFPLLFPRFFVTLQRRCGMHKMQPTSARKHEHNIKILWQRKKRS
jgi:hypothetical protein